MEMLGRYYDSVTPMHVTESSIDGSSVLPWSYRWIPPPVVYSYAASRACGFMGVTFRLVLALIANTLSYYNVIVSDHPEYLCKIQREYRGIKSKRRCVVTLSQLVGFHLSWFSSLFPFRFSADFFHQNTASFYCKFCLVPLLHGHVWKGFKSEKEKKQVYAPRNSTYSPDVFQLDPYSYSSHGYARVVLTYAFSRRFVAFAFNHVSCLKWRNSNGRSRRRPHTCNSEKRWRNEVEAKSSVCAKSLFRTRRSSNPRNLVYGRITRWRFDAQITSAVQSWLQSSKCVACVVN